MLLFELTSNEGLPWSRRWNNEGSSRSEDGCSRISLTLFRKTVRGPRKAGQRRKKCSDVSSSMPHLHLGSVQLNCLEKRCDLRSLWSTRIQVRSLRPYLSLIPYVLPLVGRIEEQKLDLNLLNSKHLRLGSRVLHLVKQ